MAENSMKPRIRFKGYTDAWEQREFNSIVKRVTEMAATDGLPRVEYEDIVSGQGTLNKDIYKKQSNKVGILFDDGDVLFGKLRPYLKNWLFAAFKGIAVGDFWVLRANNADGEYIYTLLQIDTFQNIANQATGTKMPRADWSLVYKQQFFIPRTIAEQHRIGVVFKQLDNLITLHQRKYDKFVNIKKALLEKMFPQGDETTPKIRFKGFTDAWEQRKLGDIVDRVVRKNINLESTLPLTISAQYGLVDQVEYFNNRVASRDVSGYYLVKNGEFAYNKSYSDGYPFGAIKRLDMYKMGVLSTLYIVFAIKSNEIDSEYLIAYYETDKWHRQVAERAAEGARNHGLLNISAADFFETKLKHPFEMGEQSKIGQLFRRLDNLITLHQRQLEKLKNIKSALLEKMFV